MTTIKSKRGRPTEYTAEIAAEICDAIAADSKGIKRLCDEKPHWPNKDTIFTWLKNNSEFSDQYARAKKCQVALLVDEIIEIADDCSGDTIVNEDGKEMPNSVGVARSRLQISSRQWVASKLIPRVYGGNPEDTHTSEDPLAKIRAIVAELNKTNKSEY